MKKFLYAFAALAFWAPSLWCQPAEEGPGYKNEPQHKSGMMHHPGGPAENWWQNENVLGKLDLSDVQKEKLHKIRIETEKSIITIGADLRKMEIDIREAFFEKELNEPKIKEMIKKIGELRGKIHDAIAYAMLDGAKILTTEQRMKLKDIQIFKEMHRKKNKK